MLAAVVLLKKKDKDEVEFALILSSHSDSFMFSKDVFVSLKLNSFLAHRFAYIPSSFKISSQI